MANKKLQIQECPICGARQPLTGSRCTNCGAALTGISVGSMVAPQPRRNRAHKKTGRLDAPIATHFEDGEADLYVAAVPAGSASGLILGVVVIVALLLAVGVFAIAQSNAAPDQTSTLNATQIAIIVSTRGTPTRTRPAPPPTNTKIAIIPTLNIATVTPAPPSPLPSPTQGPCMQKVGPGDTILGLAVKCGHRDMAVIDLILRMNNMASSNSLQVGQVLEIPYPTSTGIAPNGLPAATQAGGVPALVEPTLPAGVMWYIVKKGETALSLVFDLNITMRILQDLNPEIKFEQCDFGLQGGGADCTVILYEGQRLRVPAPKPTPTLTPTRSGSETAAPSPTATFNAPSAASPDNNMLFEALDLPTLRWVATGALAENEVYLVSIVDQTAGLSYSKATRDLSFQLPPEWQPADKKPHAFEWYVVVSTVGVSGTPIPGTFTTERRTFTWIGK